MDYNSSWDWETVIWTIPVKKSHQDQLKRRYLDLAMSKSIKLVLYLKRTLVFDGFRRLFITDFV